jgi:HTH-type transcriptional repressor of NAD biosynthesis genes
MRCLAALPDLERVAKVHAQSITKEAADATRVLFIDTDIHTTISYSEFLFGKQLAVSPELRAANKAHLYLYLDNDAPFVQDGTRLDEVQRNALNDSHRRVLDREGIEYQVLRGTWQEKYEQAVRLVEYTLSLRYPWSRQLILPPVPRFDEYVERDAGSHPSILPLDENGRETPPQP